MSSHLIIIGGSSGGLEAVREILSFLESPYEAAIAVVLHRHRSSIGSHLIASLSRATNLPIEEVEDKVAIRKGTVFVAPADYHLLVEQGHFALSVDELVNFSRPSLDVTMESGAHEFGPRTTAVVLSGANSDGSRGALVVDRAGGTVLIQDPSEAPAAAMPRAALELVPRARVLSTSEIGSALREKFGVLA